jgi:hypothetical protein
MVAWRRQRTLGAREVTLLLTRGDGAVDVALEGSIGDVAEAVVGLDVLLDGLTAEKTCWSASALVMLWDGSVQDAMSTMSFEGGD